MFCEQCGEHLSAEERFCPYCGYPVSIYCPVCGRKAGGDEKFCMECGARLKNSEYEENDTTLPEVFPQEDTKKTKEECEHYRTLLVQKSNTEKHMLMVTTAIILFLTVLYYINNPGEDRLLETVLIGGVIAGILLAIYGIIAGNMGVFEASKYLKKYEIIRNTAGEKEAVLFIEKEYHPEERGKGIAVNGMKMTVGGAKVAGGCFVGCLQMVTGFATSIIAVILAMAFC